MAAGIEVLLTGYLPVVDQWWPRLPELAPHALPTGPDLLAEAAMVLPAVVGGGQVRWVDIHAAIYRAACSLGMGRDRPHRLRLADEALDMFTDYLVSAGLASPRKDPALGWLPDPDQLTAQLTLAAAAGHWRRELARAIAPSWALR